MMRTTNTILFAGALLSGLALAGDEAPIIPAPGELPVATRDWCDAFAVLGAPVVKDDNPILQELKFFGRVQWQWASVDGSGVDGADFDDSFTEWRRIRLGAQAKMFHFLKLKGNINLIEDDRPSGGETDFGYQDFDELIATLDVGSMVGTAGFDSLALTFGRHKFEFSEEAHTSSKLIKTIERSALSNKVYQSARPTGVSLDAAKGAWSYTVGLFGDEDPETIGGFDNGFTYYVSLGYQATESAEYILDAVYNDGDSDTKGEFLDYEWALSLAGRYDFGRWELMWNAIFGDNGDQSAGRDGNFYGLVIMPSFWFIEDVLEGVVRYQYAGADEAEGIRLNSRYVRRIEDRGLGDVNGGRGDEHHSVYAGLNWYLCGQNLKLMTGIEYDSLNTPDGDMDAWTYWFGARTYF
jgi:hypothetical protein